MNDLSKFKPNRLAIASTEISKSEDIIYKLTKNNYDLVKKNMKTKDITLHELKQFLYNLDYIEDGSEIVELLKNTKINKNTKVEYCLEYSFFYAYLKTYNYVEKDKIYLYLTKLGKKIYKYMTSVNDENIGLFEKIIQRFYKTESNLGFIEFLRKEYSNMEKNDKLIFYKVFGIFPENIIIKEILKNSKE